MAEPDDDTVLVSAVAQYAYCPRRCSLMHVEGEFEENIYTLQGRYLHERTDLPIATFEESTRVERALPIWSDRLGLAGKADAVEFREDGTVFPVEYKRSRTRRRDMPAELQLCAQAICLEEMLGCTIRFGAVYHSSSHRRREVEFTEDLRGRTLEIVRAIRAMQKDRHLPPPADDARCRNCSLIDACVPSGLSRAAALDIQRTLFVPSDGEVVE